MSLQRPASKRGRGRRKSASTSSFSPLVLQEGGTDDLGFDFDEPPPQQQPQTKLMRRKAGSKIDIPTLKHSNAPSVHHGGGRRERPLEMARRQQKEAQGNISPSALVGSSRRSSYKPATVFQSSKTKKGNHKDNTTISMQEKITYYTQTPVSYKNNHNNSSRKQMSVKTASYHSENGGGRRIPMKMDILATVGVRAGNPPVTTSTSSPPPAMTTCTTHHDPLGNALNQKIVDLVDDDDHDQQVEAHAQEQQPLSTKKKKNKKKKGPSPTTLSISSGVSSSSSDSEDATEKDHAATAASPKLQPSYIDTLQHHHQSRRRHEDIAMASPPIPRKQKISSEAAGTSVSLLHGRQQRPAAMPHSLPQQEEEEEPSLLDRRHYHPKQSKIPIPSFQVTATAAAAAASPTKSQPQVGTSPQTSIAIHDDDDDDHDHDGYTATSGSGHKKRRSPQEQETTAFVQDEDNNIRDDHPRSRISTFVKKVGQRVMQHMTPSQSRKKQKVATTHKDFAPEPTEDLPPDLKPSSRSSSKLVGLPRKHPVKKHSSDDYYDYDDDDSSQDDFCVKTSTATTTTERDKSYELRDKIEAMGEPRESSSSWGGGGIPRKLKPNSPSSSLFTLTKANNSKNDPSPNLRNGSTKRKRKFFVCECLFVHQITTVFVLDILPTRSESMFHVSAKGNPIGKPGGTFRKPSNKDLDLPWRSDDDDEEYSSSSKRRSYDSLSSVTPGRRSTRRRTMLYSSKKVKSPEVVDMCDSDSDEDVVEVARPEVQPVSTIRKKLGMPMRHVIQRDFGSDSPSCLQINLELTRIAIGKTVYFAECEASLDPNSLDLTLFYKKTRRKTFARTRSDDSGTLGTNVLALTDGSLKGLFIYDGPDDASPAGALLVDTDDEESTDHQDGTDHQFGPLIALHIKATPENKLAAFTKSLIPDGDDDKAKYVVLELRDKEVLDIVKPLLVALKEVKKVSIVQGSEGQLFEYAASLILDNNRRLKATKRNAFLDGRPSDYALLVYPFAGDPKRMEAAAAGLTEAAGSSATSGVVATSKQGSSENTDGEGKSRHRAHFVSITVEDYERLEPGEWLNDSLVDFWMQWYVLYGDNCHSL